MKKIILAFGVTLALLFTGCGDADLGSSEDGEKRLEIQQLVDNGQYDEVILKLNDAGYQNSYPGNEYKLHLASAYLSRAGFTLDVVLDLFLNSEDTQNGTEEDTLSAASLLSDLSDKIKLSDAIQASNLFSDALNIDCVDGNSELFTNGEKEVCLFVGITGLMKTAVTLSYLTTDLDSFFDSVDSKDSNGTNEVPASMLATACALEYALVSSPKSIDDNNNSDFQCSNDANLSIDGNVKFTNNPDYEHVTIQVNAEESFSELINYSAFLRSSILSKDMCRNDYTSCDTLDYQTDGSGCYICPVAKNAEDVAAIPATNEILLDTLNNDIEALANIIPADLLEGDNVDTNDTNTTDAIEEFKQEITGGEDRDITEADLLNYFNNESDDGNTTGNYCVLKVTVEGVEQDALGTIDDNGTCIAK